MNKVDFPPLRKIVSAAAGAPPRVVPGKPITARQMKRAVEAAQGMAASDSGPDSDDSQSPVKKVRTRSPVAGKKTELIKLPINERIKLIHQHLPNQAMRGENGMLRPESVFPQWPYIREVLGDECADGIGSYLNGVNDTIVMKVCEYIVLTIYDRDSDSEGPRA